MRAKSRIPERRPPEPTEPNWNPDTRSALERLIRRGRGKGLHAVFDFDNTIVRGDIGEATMAVLARAGTLTPARAPAGISPPLKLPGGRVLTLETCEDVTQYYEAFLAPTVHGARDPSPLSNGYVWAVEMMAGLKLSRVVEATRRAFEWPVETIEVTPGKTAYTVPVFYPEMVDLMAALLRNDFDVRIVSASNVWSVRWMVLHGLDPLLRARGIRQGLAPDRVIGVSTLLSDRGGRLYKDACLVREDPAYAALEPRALGRFHLTGRLHFPVSTYSGKVAAIFEAIGCRPHLGAGDSPGDHPMLEFCLNRLWIERRDKAGYRASTRRLMKRTGPGSWMIQQTDPSGGFVGPASI